MLLVPSVLWHQWEQGAVHHFERRTTWSSKACLRVWLCLFGCNWFSAYLSVKYALHKYWISLSAFRYSGCSDIKDSHIHSVGCPSSKMFTKPSWKLLLVIRPKLCLQDPRSWNEKQLVDVIGTMWGSDPNPTSFNLSYWNILMVSWFCFQMFWILFNVP